jgi:hypothetical protein
MLIRKAGQLTITTIIYTCATPAPLTATKIICTRISRATLRTGRWTRSGRWCCWRRRCSRWWRRRSGAWSVLAALATVGRITTAISPLTATETASTRIIRPASLSVGRTSGWRRSCGRWGRSWLSFSEDNGEREECSGEGQEHRSGEEHHGLIR